MLRPTSLLEHGGDQAMPPVEMCLHRPTRIRRPFSCPTADNILGVHFYICSINLAEFPIINVPWKCDRFVRCYLRIEPETALGNRGNRSHKRNYGNGRRVGSAPSRIRRRAGRDVVCPRETSKEVSTDLVFLHVASHTGPSTALGMTKDVNFGPRRLV